jgi:LPXTG-motif cell wall-anchored protein
MVKKYFYKIIIVSIVCFYSQAVFAAGIDIVSSSRAGVYDVFLYTAKNESVNAIEGTIIFNENTILAPSLETNNSIISLWVKQPFISGNSIAFSGIIPGGFSVIYDQFGGQPATRAKLFSIIFPFAENVSSYNFIIDSAFAYANDSRGTTIKVPSKSITLPASTDKNDFPDNIDTTNTIGPHTSNTQNTPIIFIAGLVIFVIIFFYFVKRTRHHIRGIPKK